MLLLDTHVWIWYMQATGSFKKDQIDLIDEAIQSRSLYIAAISLWEIAMLASKQRIILNEPALNWIQQAIQTMHLKILPLTAEIAIESSQLPGDFHPDPADRMIVATARLHQLSIVTHDANILKYAREKYVKALEV